MWLAWDVAAAVSALCAVAWAALRRVETRPARIARPFARELSLMFALYAIWQLAGRISVINQAGAMRRGQQLWDLERAMLLPNEAGMQAALLSHGWVLQASNIYYAVAHVPAMIGCLIWLFLRDRRYYRVTRNNLAMLTGASLVVQLVAVAPPRFIESTGIVDTGLFYNQSVYSAAGYTMAGQLQAMPSIHVGWAFLVAVATWIVGRGWVRWLGVSHAVLTFIVVALTGNHYWLDGVVAGVFLVAVMWLQTVSARRLPPAESDPDVSSGPPWAGQLTGSGHSP